MDEQEHHDYESVGRPTTEPMRPGEGGYERGAHSGRDVVGRPGEDAHEGTAGQAAQDLQDLLGRPVGGSEDVLNLPPELLTESMEPDFADEPGTTDVMLAVEEGLTYFPPTDPPTMPDDDSDEGLTVLSGFAATSIEGPLEEDELPVRVQRGDDELAEAVIRALRADSYTTDLPIEVAVEDGVVYLRGTVTSLDDAEQAEEVAGRVPGVEDVEEELEIM